MLVWLTSAVPEVGNEIVRLGLGDVAADAAQLETSTQHDIVVGRLDAIFSSPSKVLVVESKLKSTYGDGQLRKYLDWLDQVHSTRTHRGLMTLTERQAPWPSEDVARADALGIAASICPALA
jgi:hypothetical protein